MRPTRCLVLALLLAAPGLPRAARDAKPKLAVIDLVAVGASKELAAAAGGAVANELDRLGAFQVMTADAIRAMLAFEKQKQMLGCADAGCLAEIGGALGVDHVVSGKVTRLAAGGGAPETVSIDLTLSSARNGQREGSAIETARSEAELVTRIGRAVQKLVAKVLAGRAGRLVLAAAEPGALVKVDGEVKGSTPLQGQIALPAGPHFLSVEKEGFVSYQRDISIEPNKVLEERAVLVPSPDFIRAYEGRQRRLRTGAWISTGLAASSVAAALWLQLDANRIYGNETTPGTFLYARRKLQDGIESEGGTDLRAQANDLKSRVEFRQTMSYVAIGVGGASAVAAAWFWIAGEDPDRYARYREARATLEVAPMPGGAYAALTFGF